MLYRSTYFFICVGGRKRFGSLRGGRVVIRGRRTRLTRLVVVEIHAFGDSWHYKRPNSGEKHGCGGGKNYEIDFCTQENWRGSVSIFWIFFFVVLNLVRGVIFLGWEGREYAFVRPWHLKKFWLQPNIYGRRICSNIFYWTFAKQQLYRPIENSTVKTVILLVLRYIYNIWIYFILI